MLPLPHPMVYQQAQEQNKLTPGVVLVCEAEEGWHPRPRNHCQIFILAAGVFVKLCETNKLLGKPRANPPTTLANMNRLVI